MRTDSEHDGNTSNASIAEAEERFRSALARSSRNRDFIGEVESAAAQYCREMRRQGHAPERVLKDAKQVIYEVLDHHAAPIAEAAVQSCIQHYYRPD